MTDQTQLDLHAAGQYVQGCGSLLRNSRERAGLSLAEAGAQLKMPARVLQALEDENWQQLGAPVFVRGQLRSYAKLLKVDIEPYLEEALLQPVRPAVLISHSHTPRYKRIGESIARRAVYVVITAAIAIPVWVATQSHVGENPTGTTASLDVVPEAAITGGQPSTSAEPKAAGNGNAPYVASLTPIPRTSAHALTLRMVGDSWVQVFAPDGTSVEKGLLKAGEERSFRSGQVGRVV
ncbi:MAG: helix-turn-helix domain-containing protein, partial [Proteobacteria bacterium]